MFLHKTGLKEIFFFFNSNNHAELKILSKKKQKKIERYALVPYLFLRSAYLYINGTF